MKSKTLKKVLILFFMAVVCAGIVLPAAPVYAEMSAEPLPWEGPLDKIVKSLTGFWAYAIIIIAFIASAAMMFFGQAEMQGWVRNLIFLIMVASFLVGGGMFARNILGIGGMLLP